MSFQIIRGNIVDMQVDAIVNAANYHLQPGGGVCGAIFEAAGYAELQKACAAIGHCPTGNAVITPGFALKAKYIIHTVGPVWQGGYRGEEDLLRSAYTASMALAVRHGLRSIAFPLISSGIYGYPKDQALQVALSAIQEFLMREEDLNVTLVVFDRTAFSLSKNLFHRIESYIDEHYVERRLRIEEARRSSAFDEFLHASEAPAQSTFDDFSEYLDEGPLAEEALNPADHAPLPDENGFVLSDRTAPDATPLHPKSATTASVRAVSKQVPVERTLEAPASQPEHALEKLKRLLAKRNVETFSDMVLRLVDEKGFAKDSIVYKRANLDRSVFSKLRSNRNYTPSKSTAIALAVALELNMDQTRDLLTRAGYALSPSDLGDVIISFFIENGVHDIFEINAALFSYDQPLLGARV